MRNSSATSLRKVVVLGMGGTIAGKAADSADNIGYTAAQVGVAELLKTLPAVQHLECVSEQVAQVDSKDMEFDTLRLLAERCRDWLQQDAVAGIVITHGTDTLEETAFFLHCTLAASKPVVLTCAMRPASALVPDGPQNMLDAISVAATAGARGVMAVCAGTLHSARDVQKVHTYRLDAFSSGDAGPIGYVEEGVVRLLHEWPQAGPLLSSTPDLRTGDASWPRVEIVLNYPGAGGAIVESLVRDGVRGIVAAGTGNGTLHHALQAALVQAQAAGVRVVRASRCATGRVLARPDDALPDSAGLSPVKARIRMVLELLA